jgi:hypothetical protein
MVARNLIETGHHCIEVLGGTEGHWATEAPRRQAVTWHRRGIVPMAQRAGVRMITSQKRNPILGAARRRLSRWVPSLSHQAE